VNDSSRLLAMSGNITLSWKLPDCPASNGHVVAHHLRRHHGHGLGYTGFTLLGMMLLPVAAPAA
jgi:hypothetical protein